MSKVRIVEMGPRDGLQNESQQIDVGTRVEFVSRLEKAGLSAIEAGAFVSEKWVPQMAGSAEVLRRLRGLQESGEMRKKTKLLALVPNGKGMEQALAAGVRDVAVFVAASESFSQKNTNATIKETFVRAEAVLQDAKRNRIRVRGYVSTCFYCPFEGRIRESKVLTLAERLMDMGVYEVSIGDTIGAANPKQVRSLVKGLKRAVGVENVAMHLHDTRGTALANILAAADLGVSVFDSSLGGLGGCPYAPGAAGNVATEDVVYMFEGMGMKTGVSLEMLNEISQWIGGKLGRRLRGARPFHPLRFGL